MQLGNVFTGLVIAPVSRAKARYELIASASGASSHQAFRTTASQGLTQTACLERVLRQVALILCFNDIATRCLSFSFAT